MADLSSARRRRSRAHKCFKDLNHLRLTQNFFALLDIDAAAKRKIRESLLSESDRFFCPPNTLSSAGEPQQKYQKLSHHKGTEFTEFEILS
jgi:hypothetical protein